MANAFRTLIITSANVVLAREVAASFGSGAVGMWTTPLSPSGLDPATHYISTGIIPEEFAYMMPTQVWEQDENGDWVLIGTDPGSPEAVWQAASAQGVTCTLAQVQTIFNTADVTPQEPFVAMGRLGLKIVNPVEDL